METVFEFIIVLNAFVWRPPMMVLVWGAGLWLTFGTRFVQLRHFFHAWRIALPGAFKKDTRDLGEGDVTPFQALMTAIAATVGNGNIAAWRRRSLWEDRGAPVWMWLTG